jgi:DMSO/TMAO reductase YedYZ heme-binding membrane subunit
LAYLAGLLAVLHYIGSVKADLRQPLAWAVILILLLIFRIKWVKQRLASFSLWNSGLPIDK